LAQQADRRERRDERADAAQGENADGRQLHRPFPGPDLGRLNTDKKLHREGINMRMNVLAGIGTCAALALTAAIVAPSTPHAQGAAPRYEFDASWNKPFPNRWINGGLGGLCVDANDHVLVLNRQDVNKPELAAGAMAPPMLEFDSAGNLVHSWGDPKLIDSRLH